MVITFIRRAWNLVFLLVLWLYFKFVGLFILKFVFKLLLGFTWILCVYAKDDWLYWKCDWLKLKSNVFWFILVLFVGHRVVVSRTCSHDHCLNGKKRQGKGNGKSKGKAKETPTRKGNRKSRTVANVMNQLIQMKGRIWMKVPRERRFQEGR